jgi:type VI secretion system protein ImpA
MSLIDTDNLLQPIPGNDPAGANLEYDRAFADLERSARGKPEQQIGQSIAPGEPPDWKAVQSQAVTLLSRSKDLRVVSHLLRALLHRHGFEGLNEGLAVIRAMLERFWAPIHPQLDPDDNNDPTGRLNALAVLSDSEVVNVLRLAPLFRSRAFGPVGLRDIAMAAGQMPATPDTQKLEMNAVEAAFQDCPLPDLETTAQALRSALEHIKAIEGSFMEHAGLPGPDVSALVGLVEQANQFLQPRLVRRRAAEAATDGVPGETTAHSNGIAGAATVSGDIRTRDDVVRALDKICGYYERHEPSSPLPLLLRRCKRLATMSFIEIVREMAPDGLSQVEVITGKREES